MIWPSLVQESPIIVYNKFLLTLIDDVCTCGGQINKVTSSNRLSQNFTRSNPTNMEATFWWNTYTTNEPYFNRCIQFFTEDVFKNSSLGEKQRERDRTKEGESGSEKEAKRQYMLIDCYKKQYAHETANVTVKGTFTPLDNTPRYLYGWLGKRPSRYNGDSRGEREKSYRDDNRTQFWSNYQEYWSDSVDSSNYRWTIYRYNRQKWVPIRWRRTKVYHHHSDKESLKILSSA